MRIVVTGVGGQVARALQELAAPGLECVAIGRPTLDLAQPDTIAPALRAAAPDVIVSAAAYTAVDKAESEAEAAFAINARGAGLVAAAAADLGVPIIQLSTDYVFDGAKSAAYVETDPTGPLNVYGASKLAGEQAVQAATRDHLILRCSWIYSPWCANFVRTMLRLAGERPEVAVVADQIGRPTAAHDIAVAVGQVAVNLLLRPDEAVLRGVFHFAPQGEANWAQFAEAIFEEARRRDGPSARVRPIATADYPTPARRPANSRLNGAKLLATHGVRAPHWRDALRICLDQMLGPADKASP